MFVNLVLTAVLLRQKCRFWGIDVFLFVHNLKWFALWHVNMKEALRANQRITWSYRVTLAQPRIISKGWNHSAKRMSSLRSSWNRQNFACSRSCIPAWCQLPQGSLFSNCGQIYRRKCPIDQRNVQLRQGSSALHHFYGRNRCYWW